MNINYGTGMYRITRIPLAASYFQVHRDVCPYTTWPNHSINNSAQSVFSFLILSFISTSISTCI